MNTRFARLRWFLGGAIAATALIFSTGASNENDRQPDVRRDQVAVAPAASPAAAIAQRDEADDGKLRIICFGAHPDDCELRAAGVAAKWAALGHHVKFVAVTNGDIGHWQIAGGVLAQRRSAEVKRCAKVLGIETEVLDIHDVILKKISAVEFLESQFYEGGCCSGITELPQTAAEQAARKKEVHDRFDRRFAATADRFRDALAEWYGKDKAAAIGYAEAFEICEYGSQPTKEELQQLFPFFPD